MWNGTRLRLVRAPWCRCALRPSGNYWTTVIKGMQRCVASTWPGTHSFHFLGGFFPADLPVIWISTSGSWSYCHIHPAVKKWWGCREGTDLPHEMVARHIYFLLFLFVVPEEPGRNVQYLKPVVSFPTPNTSFLSHVLSSNVNENVTDRNAMLQSRSQSMLCALLFLLFFFFFVKKLKDVKWEPYETDSRPFERRWVIM